MRKTLALFSATLCVGVLVLVAGIRVVNAQDGNQEKPRVVVSTTVFGSSGVQDSIPQQPLLLPMPGGGFTWRGGMGVKDSPFSGEFVRENIQTLNDGNRIIHRTSTMIYRDGQGRTRQETTSMLQGFPNDEKKEHKIIQIFDPVAGHTYTIDPQNRTVHKFVDFARPIVGNNSVGAAAGATFNVAVPRLAAGTIAGRAADGTAIVGPSASVSSAASPGAPQRRLLIPSGNNGEVKSESLGTELIEGVAAEGTRITHTIPAGVFGNERPIDITTDRWFSQELKIDVLLKTTDPRTGESINRLTNINRGEPDPSLFEIPSDYTVQEIRPPVLGRDEADRIKLLRERGKPNGQ